MIIQEKCIELLSLIPTDDAVHHTIEPALEALKNTPTQETYRALVDLLWTIVTQEPPGLIRVISEIAALIFGTEPCEEPFGILRVGEKTHLIKAADLACNMPEECVESLCLPWQEAIEGAPGIVIDLWPEGDAKPEELELLRCFFLGEEVNLSKIDPLFLYRFGKFHEISMSSKFNLVTSELIWKRENLDQMMRLLRHAAETDDKSLLEAVMTNMLLQNRYDPEKLEKAKGQGLEHCRSFDKESAWLQLIDKLNRE